MSLILYSAAQWLKPPAGTKKKTKGWTEKLTWKYIRNNLRKVVFLVLYILINLGLAGYTINKYIDSNAFVIGKDLVKVSTVLMTE